MTLADLRQAPVTRHAPVALKTPHARPALALTGLRVAGVGHATEPVAVAQARTARAVRPERGGFPVRATAVPRIGTLDHLDTLYCKEQAISLGVIRRRHIFSTDILSYE